MTYLPGISSRSKVLIKTSLWGMGIAVAAAYLMSMPLLAKESEPTWIAAVNDTPNLTVPHSSPTTKCNACHMPDTEFSHPVGVRPSRSIPAGFPLLQGQMTCITCHTEHPSTAALSSFDALAGQFQLRGEFTGSQFCASCHDSNSTTSSDAHAMQVGRAHLGWALSPPGMNDRTKSWAQSGPESTSIGCMSCHDGSIATEVGHRPIAAGGFAVSMPEWGSNEHPVDIAYRLTHRDTDGPLTPVGSLDQRIRLFQGDMTCASCHSIYSRQPNHLTVSNVRSGLCLSCHQY